MIPLPIKRDVILPRIIGIEGELVELRALAEIPYEEYVKGPGYKVAEYHLHRALEGVFNIGNHILARIPGGAGVSKYRDVARLLGEKHIVPQEFADGVLQKMAGYRTRLVHFYAEITPQETYRTIREDLGDFETFLRAIRDFLEHPERFGLTVE
ncbi:MAG: DUF86 domain-containing protein [Candidatus Uhrbacteria bacterium]